MIYHYGDLGLLVAVRHDGQFNFSLLPPRPPPFSTSWLCLLIPKSKCLNHLHFSTLHPLSWRQIILCIHLQATVFWRRHDIHTIHKLQSSAVSILQNDQSKEIKTNETFKHYQTCPANQQVQWFFSQSFVCLLPGWQSQKHSQVQAEIQSFHPCRHQILPSCSTSLHSAIQIFLSCGSVIKTNGQPVDQVPNYLDAKLLKNQLGNLVPNNYWEVLAGTRCDVARLASNWCWNRIAQSSGPWLKRTTPT